MSLPDLLVIIGITLCLLALILRNAHQEILRAAALRRQTARHARIAGNEDTLHAHVTTPHPLVLHLPLIYRSTLLIGAVLTFYGYWKR